MAKNKKKKNKKNQSFFKAIKPFVQDTRVLYSLLGAVGVGVALASTLGTAKGRTLVDKLTNAVKGLGQDQPDQTTANPEPEQAPADKKMKPAKQFAVEQS